jgi:predicted homoserine dehydrogenase-like protein
MVTKEAESAVGPILHAKARAAGLVYTPVDGDQPSLLISLVTRARLLGLEVVCAGKSGEYDFVLDGDRVAGPQGSIVLRDRARFWSDVAYRGDILKGWLHATVPDYCEMCIVANATGLAPDVPAMHAPAARTVELPELFRPGGLLSKEGAVDMFVCLRRADELSFAGGVFVVVRCDDAATWAVLKEKGIPVSMDSGYALLHNPVHLLGIEAPASVMAAALLGLPAARLEPRFDLQARANRALAKGTLLSIGERHVIGGLDALIAPAQAARGSAPVPYYLAAGCQLTADVPAGALLTRNMVRPPAASVLWRLREEQDREFHADR